MEGFTKPILEAAVGECTKQKAFSNGHALQAQTVYSAKCALFHCSRSPVCKGTVIQL